MVVRKSIHIIVPVLGLGGGSGSARTLGFPLGISVNSTLSHRQDN